MTNVAQRRLLPLIPNSDKLRKQAKARLKQMRINSPGARLSDAQSLLAAEYGFPEWASLLTEVAYRRQSKTSSFRQARIRTLRQHRESEGQFAPEIFPAGLSAHITVILLGLLAVGLTFMPFPPGGVPHTHLVSLGDLMRHVFSAFG